MIRMFRGTVLYFRMALYLRLIRGIFKHAVIPATTIIALFALAGLYFHLEPSLALAAQDETIPTVEVRPQDTKPIEQLITKIKPIARSRLSKDNSRIFGDAHQESLATPNTSIELNLPILMFHKTPVDFEAQIQHLQASGYNAITMRTASRILRGIESAPAKPVVITFDDGFSDQLVAFDLLRRYNTPATFYVMPGGELSQWCLGADRLNQSCGDSYMNWADIKMLSDSGLIEIGSHTIDHAQLNSLDSVSKRNQIFIAKQIIEQKIGKQVVSFAYPYGAFDSETIELAREAGYTSSVSTIGGITQSTDTLFELRRVRNAYDLP